MTEFAFAPLVAATREALAAAPEGASVHTLRVTSRQTAALRSDARIRSFELGVDEPPSLGGADTAPNPVEYALLALAACQVDACSASTDANGSSSTSSSGLVASARASPARRRVSADRDETRACATSSSLSLERRWLARPGPPLRVWSKRRRLSRTVRSSNSPNRCPNRVGLQRGCGITGAGVELQHPRDRSEQGGLPGAVAPTIPTPSPACSWRSTRHMATVAPHTLVAWESSTRGTPEREEGMGSGEGTVGLSTDIRQGRSISAFA